MKNSFKNIVRVFANTVLTVGVLSFSSASFAGFGVAQDYNVFIEQDFNSQYSQSNGPMAVGGDVSLNGYAVATTIQVPAQNQTLIVGGNLSFVNGRIHQGSVLVGGDISGVDAGVVNGLVSGASLQGSAQLPFSFPAEFNDLKTNAIALSQSVTTGQVEYQYGGVRITGDCTSNVQVLEIDGAQLLNSNHVVVNCIPNNATVVLNVSGQSIGMQNMGFSPLVAVANKLVWNFYQAQSVSLSNVEVPGLVLAPFADITTTWGAIDGTVIGKSWQGSYSLKHRPFTGDVSSLLQTGPIDADNDGVNDTEDQCPETPVGAVVNSEGCAPVQLDTDNDGVNDAVDQCAQTPAGETPNSEGCAPTQLDSDNDTVNDAVDQCPATPEGEAANAEGCAPSQLDSDNDTVNDAIDQCPATPAGEAANAEGCAPSQLDTDNDGVNDAVDQCAETPADETANAEGCAPSQLDSDNDTVNDAVDQCPATPAGEPVNTVGCSPSQLDSDNDTVSDAIDQCPATPAGEAVNAEGCAPSQLDTDSDGVNDAVDQCPATPGGEAANAEGCAPTQLDSDNDTVNDAVDQCSATPAGEAVNAEGCALSQLDTDNDGVNDAIDQCADTPAGETPNVEGCAPTQLDSDNDTVNDAVDRCPATPSGEAANAKGCAPSQLDTDNDGANDAVDQCPATPSGEAANAEGCAPSQLDTDNDGVNDAVDQCPATPAGEAANADGCAPTQLDSDNDTVNDAIDQCPTTPEGEAANADGCAPSQLDTDNDGVNDSVDQCADTPAGETPNVEGCAPTQLDSDNDTVNDAVDQCPATPEGEAANADGCAPSQLDADNDGVNDAIDQCADTPANETSNAEGCAPSQLDTDNDGINDAIDQCPATPAGESPNAEGCSRDQIDTDGDGVADYLDAFPNDANETADLDGDGIGDNADTDRDGDGVENSADAFPNDPNESVDTDGDGVGNNADPDADGDGVPNEDDYFPTDPESSSVPSVQITSPATLITVGSSPLRIAGTVDDLNATIIVNGIEIPQNNGSFEADVVIEEGANNIIVRAIDSKNHEGTATITVSLDKTPPYITLQSPEDGGKAFSDTIAVSGLVNDIVRGTVSEDEANVQVVSPLSNITASVSNRSYLAENVRLQMGENQITITASDAVGNTNSETITVTYEPQTDKKIELISGNAQTAGIQTSVSQPLVVKLTDAGQPVADKTVIFRVTEGDGVLQPGTAAEGNGAVIKTNAEGVAQVNYRLGSRAGTGNQKVLARAVGFKGEVEFYHSATYGEGVQMGVIAGSNQRGSVRQPLPQPFVLAVTDMGANLIPNAQVEFMVAKGSGTFANGELTFSTTTDMDGRASASFILGAEEGLDVQRVTAKLVAGEAVAEFTASGFMPGDPGDTKISGVVLDNEDVPVPNVTIRIEGSTRQAVSDDEGQFTITETPVGPVHLIVEGSTTTRAGEWPSLSYNIVAVPGVDNPIASPIYLVELDVENAVLVGAEDTIVTHPDLPGFELNVKAGSVTFPDGSGQGMLSITKVNGNKIPMAPPNGMQPQLIVTIQPHGAKFDPPARLTIPNTDAHPPLAEIEMYSYDHDLEEFVTIGLGTVSKDGSTISSNVGSGVIKAGWHCGSQPGGSGCCRPKNGGGGGCPTCQQPKFGACSSLGDPSSCEPVPDEPTPVTTCTYCDGGQEIKANGQLLDANGDVQEGKECKICKKGKEGNAPDGFGCDDGLFCTSFDAEAGGRLDACQSGQCKGEPFKRKKVSEQVAEFDLGALSGAVGVIETLAGVARRIPGCKVKLGGGPGDERVIQVQGKEIEIKDCCEDSDEIVTAFTSERNVTVKSGFECKADVSIPRTSVKARIRGAIDIRGKGFVQSTETPCTDEDKCNLQGGLSVGAVGDLSLFVELGSNSATGNEFLSIDAGIRATIGTAGIKVGTKTSSGCNGVETKVCTGPVYIFGKVKVVSFVSYNFRQVWIEAKCFGGDDVDLD